jgi:hypothetical protein
LTWTWKQTFGELWRDGRLVSRGYSGRGRGRNNPALEGAPGLGPIPAGRWRIGEAYQSKSVGPLTIPVYAVDDAPGDDVHAPTGRSAFRIHGDSISAPGTASRGCIILPRDVRTLIIQSGDRDLVVRA